MGWALGPDKTQTRTAGPLPPHLWDTPVFSSSLATGLSSIELWQEEGCVQVALAGTCASLSGCASHMRERLERTMRKESAHIPVAGTASAVPWIPTGYRMQCNLVGI